MKQRILALFLFLVLLTPAVQREVHTFEHRNDSSCAANDSKHFHEKHHYCTLCDFSIPVHLGGVFLFTPEAYQVLSFIAQPHTGFFLSTIIGPSGPTRAPPVSFSEFS